jgi:hypothetical protein
MIYPQHLRTHVTLSVATSLLLHSLWAGWIAVKSAVVTVRLQVSLRARVKIANAGAGSGVVGSYVQKFIKSVQKIRAPNFGSQRELAMHPTSRVEVGKGDLGRCKRCSHVLQLLDHDTLPLLNKR